MGKWTDKDYITQREWTEFFGGAKSKTCREDKDFRRLPYDHCALSLIPFVNPVCTADGIIFDSEQLVKYFEEYGTKNPVTGVELDPAGLVRLHFSRNANGTRMELTHDWTILGEYHCPIMLKTFNNHSHIVANRKTGNVFSKEAIEKLNAETHDWHDLISGDPFTRADLITIQDPANVDKQNLSSFAHLREEASRKKTVLPVLPLKTAQSSPYAGSHSQGRVAAALTSTSMTPVLSNDMVLLSEEELMFQRVKAAASVVIRTSFGDLQFDLFVSKAPRTCFNFISLSKRGYYKGTRFHRNISGFMVQGGDPAGTGRGGESIWGKPFADEFHQSLAHDQRGLLCMANKGPNTNTSQFFVTYAPAPYLDRKHTIFGRLSAGMNVLDSIESISSDAKDQPMTPIIILDVVVLRDPFQEFRASLAEQKTPQSNVNIARPKGKTTASTEIGKYMPKTTANK